MAGCNVPNRLKPTIAGAAQQTGIPADVIAGVLDVETCVGQDRSVSSAGAKGIAQFIDSTARDYHVNVNDDASSIYGLARYLKALGYSKDPHGALEAYNGGGPGYAEAVMASAHRLAPSLAGATPSVPLGGNAASSSTGNLGGMLLKGFVILLLVWLGLGLLGFGTVHALGMGGALRSAAGEAAGGAAGGAGAGAEAAAPKATP